MADPITQMPGHLLRRCHQIAVAIFLDQCGQFHLTPLQFAILQTLDQAGAQDQVTLGGVTAMDRSSTTLVVGKLEDLGLVRRNRSTLDQRAKIVTITASGKKLLNAALPAVKLAQQRIVAPLDAEESARLLELLDKLALGNNDASRAPQR